MLDSWALSPSCPRASFSRCPWLSTFWRSHRSAVGCGWQRILYELLSQQNIICLQFIPTWNIFRNRLQRKKLSLEQNFYFIFGWLWHFSWPPANNNTLFKSKGELSKYLSYLRLPLLLWCLGERPLLVRFGGFDKVGSTGFLRSCSSLTKLVFGIGGKWRLYKAFNTHKK